MEDKCVSIDSAISSYIEELNDLGIGTYYSYSGTASDHQDTWSANTPYICFRLAKDSHVISQFMNLVKFLRAQPLMIFLVSLPHFCLKVKIIVLLIGLQW